MLPKRASRSEQSAQNHAAAPAASASVKVACSPGSMAASTRTSSGFASPARLSDAPHRARPTGLGDGEPKCHQKVARERQPWRLLLVVCQARHTTPVLVAGPLRPSLRVGGDVFCHGDVFIPSRRTQSAHISKPVSSGPKSAFGPARGPR